MNLENLQITLDYKCSCCYYVFVVRKNFSWYVEAYFVIQLVRAVQAHNHTAGLGHIKKPRGSDP